MAVHSSPMGGVLLTGNDAQAFLRRARTARPSRRARASALRGRKLAEQVARNGCAVLEAPKPK